MDPEVLLHQELEKGQKAQAAADVLMPYLRAVEDALVEEFKSTSIMGIENVKMRWDGFQQLINEIHKEIQTGELAAAQMKRNAAEKRHVN